MTGEKQVVIAVAKDSRSGKWEFIGLFKDWSKSYYKNRAESVLLKYGIADKLVCHECTVSTLEQTAEEVAETYDLPDVPWEDGRSDFYMDLEDKYKIRDFMFDRDGHFMDSTLLEAVKEYAESIYRSLNAGCKEDTLWDYVENIQYDIIRDGKSVVYIPIMHYKGVVGSRRIPSIYRDILETAEVQKWDIMETAEGKKSGWSVKSAVTDGCYDIMPLYNYTLLSVPITVQTCNDTKG